MRAISRREIMTLASTVAAVGNSAHCKIAHAGGRRLADFGWVWEGQGLDSGTDPSIFGVGEGARYFGLNNAVYIFHPNDDLGMEKLRDLREVICDISKWKVKRCDANRDGRGFEPAIQLYTDGKVSTVLKEAQTVVNLSRAHRNVTGVYHDDTLGSIQRGTRSEEFAQIHAALARANPPLKFWSVMLNDWLDRPEWEGFKRYLDVINLWIWKPENLPKLDSYIDQCRSVFPGKPIVLGCFLRDYSALRPLPMNLLKIQWDHVLRYTEASAIAGYSILGTFLIDGHQQQARYVRDFIAAN